MNGLFYDQPKEAVLANFNSNFENGLPPEEAESRSLTYGKNKLQEAKKAGLLQRFFIQLKDPMLIILILAALVSGVTAYFSNEGYADVIIILTVVVLNAVLGVFQESKAEAAIAALQEMAAATSRVHRGGETTTVKSEDLVPGDIVLLEAGDTVPADGRLLEAATLQIEEAALTGESLPVQKTTSAITLPEDGAVPLGDRFNMAYMGSNVAYGRGTLLVTATGMQTEMGKIATALTETADGQTPLQKKLAHLSKTLSFIVLGVCAFIFAFSLWRAGNLSLTTVLHTFMVAVSLAVAAIPEGLATVVTLVLSVGVTNMSKRGAIIRKLTAVETLGCASIICSDKTGTLTQNKMTVVEVYTEDTKALAVTMALCCDSAPGPGGEAVGEPTENALVNYATGLNLHKKELEEKSPRISEAPFDSMRKMMSTLHDSNEGYVQCTKGAPDELLKRCTHYLAEDGEVLPLTTEKQQEILNANRQMAQKALRVLGAAMRRYSALPRDITPEDLEQDLVFVGLAGIMDPVRAEVKAAIDECRTAGIRPIMITGDHKDTATSIATSLGIVAGADEVLTGAQLSAMSDEEFDKVFKQYGAYARVQPEHKVRIVNAWRSHGYITAMTGDGVNDAPSIKSADIGVGMGITGTAVTKNVADMVLADDNFATIVSAVEEGRRIYDNILKAIQFLLSSNASEVLGIFIATLFGFVLLEPAHLLFINLISDSFPALALGFEKAAPDIMHRKPRATEESIFANGLGKNVIIQGVLITAITLAAYFSGVYFETGAISAVQSHIGVTMAFVTLSLAEVFHSFNMRSQKESIFTMPANNIYIWAAALFSIVVIGAVVYLPFLAAAFSLVPLSVIQLATCAGLAFTIVPAVEIAKLFARRAARKNNA